MSWNTKTQRHKDAKKARINELFYSLSEWHGVKRGPRLESLPSWFSP